MRKLMFALAIVAGAFMTAGPVSAQCRYIMNDVGRFHGYLSGPLQWCCRGLCRSISVSSQYGCDGASKRGRPEGRPAS